jgi:DNA-binding HxlR family transcriptional regulator
MKLQKITDSSNPSVRRRYDDACGTAHALDLIGERWALLVMRELMLGPKRFRDIRADLPGISANVLTQRLEGLEAAGLLARKRLPPPVSAQVYELTEWGLEAEPIVQSLGRWAARSPAHDPTLPISATSLMLSFRTMFSAERAGDMAATIGIRIGDETFRAVIANGKLDVARGTTDGANVVLSGPPQAIAAVVYGGQPLEMIAVDGERTIAKRFAGLFPLPAKADMPA